MERTSQPCWLYIGSGHIASQPDQAHHIFSHLKDGLVSGHDVSLLSGLAGYGKSILVAPWLTTWSNLGQVHGKFSESVGVEQRALQQVGPDTMRVSGLTRLVPGGAYCQAAQSLLVVDALQKTIQLSQVSQELVTAPLAMGHLRLMWPQYWRLRFAIEIVK